jgi:hypothetical protein
MSTTTDNTSRFPFFEEENFNGWRVQFNSHLMGKSRAHLALNHPRPADLPLNATAAQRRTHDALRNTWDERNEIAFSELMCACRKNPKTKALSEMEQFDSAAALMERLSARFALTDQATKAMYHAQFHGIRQMAGETGTAYLDRLNKAAHNLRVLGEPVSDSAKMSKLVSSSQDNPEYQALARSIYSTPDMTFDKASSLFEGYERTGLSAASTISSDNVSYVSNNSSESGRRQTPPSQKKKKKKKQQSNARNTKRKAAHPCMFCDSTDHSSFNCNLKQDAINAVRRSTKKNKTNSKAKTGRWNDDEDLDSDGHVSMISTVNTVASDGSSVMLDSGAAVSVFRHADHMDDLRPCSRPVGTANLHGSLPITAQGSVGGVPDVLLSDSVRHNILSISQLCKLGFRVMFDDECVQIYTKSSDRVLATGWLEDGVYNVPVNDIKALLPVEHSKNIPSSVSQIASVSPAVDELDLLHYRTGDTAKSILKQAVRQNLIQGVHLHKRHFTNKSPKHMCDICARMKMTRISFPASRDKWMGKRVGEYVCADILPFNGMASREGFENVLLIVDRASRWIWLYPLQRRNEKEVLASLKIFLQNDLSKLGQTCGHFHSDGGGELISTLVTNYLNGQGCGTSHSPRDTPEMNSISERRTRTLKEKMVCMLMRSGLPLPFWWCALKCAAWLLNRLPTRTAQGYITPHEYVYDRLPNLKWIRTWGCKAYAMRERGALRKDLQGKADSGFLVGYGDVGLGYEIFLPETNKIVTTVHVIFNEVIPSHTDEYWSEMTKLQVKVDPVAREVNDYVYLVGVHHLDDEDGLVYVTTRVVNQRGYIVGFRKLVTPDGQKTREEKVPIHIADIVRMSFSHKNNTTSPSAQAPDKRSAGGLPDRRVGTPEVTPTRKSWNSQGRLATETPPRVAAQRNMAKRPLALDLSQQFIQEDKRQRRQRNVNNLDECTHMFSMPSSFASVCSLLFDADTPTSYKKALESPESARWREAMQLEIDALKSRRCWRVIKKPSHYVPLLRTHFVYKIKTKDGRVDRYKARLVVDGSGQKHGIDYKETFAPVVKYTTFRMLMAICHIYGLTIHQMDVSNAFLYAKVDEDVYVLPHPELNIPPGYVLKLLQALYGLKQAPRNWNHHLIKFLISLGFEASPVDTCLLHKMVDNGEIVLVAVFVDDLLIAASSDAARDKVKNLLSAKFKMVDMGRVHEFLGIRITQSSSHTTIDQQIYCETVLERYAPYVSSRNYNTTPMCQNLKLSKQDMCSDLNAKKVAKFPYSSIIGALMYLAVLTRIDIAYVVGHLARFSSKPTYQACLAVSRVLQYLKLTSARGLRYSGSVLNLHGFSDSDWASCLDTRKSVTGWVVFMAGAPVAWQSKLQPIVTTSSMEAEYLAMYALICELLWMLSLLHSIKLTRAHPVKLYIDNAAAECLAKNPVYHQRSKHIDVKYHWLRQHVNSDVFELLHVASDDNRADIFTKMLTSALFHKHNDAMGHKLP